MSSTPPPINDEEEKITENGTEEIMLTHSKNESDLFFSTISDNPQPKAEPVKINAIIFL
jgi:hypothetical protein